MPIAFFASGPKPNGTYFSNNLNIYNKINERRAYLYPIKYSANTRLHMKIGLDEYRLERSTQKYPIVLTGIFLK